MGAQDDSTQRDPRFLSNQLKETVLVLQVEGELDIGSADALREALDAAESQGGDVDAVAGVRGERDLGGADVEQPRGKGASARQGAELDVLRDAMRRGAHGVEGIERGAGAGRQRTDAGAVQVGRLGSPGEIGLAKFGRVKGHAVPCLSS